MKSIREFVLQNKSKIIKIVLLLVIFFTITAYINGRNIYKEQMKMVETAKTVNAN